MTRASVRVARRVEALEMPEQYIVVGHDDTAPKVFSKCHVHHLGCPDRVGLPLWSLPRVNTS